AVTLALALFAAFGVIAGIYAHSWDHTAFVTNIVILPLTFLGGVFYSVDRLPAPWHEISHANPIFYLLNAVRYGFLGTSDVSFVLLRGWPAAARHRRHPVAAVRGGDRGHDLRRDRRRRDLAAALALRGGDPAGGLAP